MWLLFQLHIKPRFSSHTTMQGFSEPVRNIYVQSVNLLCKAEPVTNRRYLDAQPILLEYCAANICRIINKSFASDKIFQNALNSAFEFFINLGQRAPEYISLYMDDRLRKGVKGVSDDNDIETVLDKVMILFRYLSEKDMFEKYYKQHLAKRLLSGRAVSLSARRLGCRDLKKLG